MATLRLPEKVYAIAGDVVVFNQLAVKIEMDHVSNDAYYAWLDRMTNTIGFLVPGAAIVEREDARTAPPLNTAVYYDTADYRILPTGSLLRTSCNRITHAFCAFKLAQDLHSVRSDHRFVFSGNDKRVIQTAPISDNAVAIVKKLLRRRDIVHPGTYLERHLGLMGDLLEPAICLEDYRYTFFVWLDNKDALRCSIDRFVVSDLRLPTRIRRKIPVSEVELAIYPRITPAVASDQRVLHLLRALSDSLCAEFNVSITEDIKYQRAARSLGLYKTSAQRNVGTPPDPEGSASEPI